MPRIDPLQLLKCLSVLLSPTGGIKSKDEVQRLANLMTKFSKKLVSKCIYVSILKATETDLLNMFMASGGWDLTFSWLSDGVAARNWPLVKQLVDLLLVCPVDIDRLKTNACPKLIKTLSKDSTADENVRTLACRLVEQWLRIVRGDDVPLLPSRIEEPSQPEEGTPKAENTHRIEDKSSLEKSQTHASSETVAVDGHLPVYKITIRAGKQVLSEINAKAAEEDSSTETSAVEEFEPPSEDIEDDDDDDDDEDYVIKPVKLNKKPAAAKGKRAAKIVNKKERESTESGSSASKSPGRAKDSAKPPPKKAKVVEPVKPKLAKNKIMEPKAKEVATAKKVKDPEEETSSKPKNKLNLSLKNRRRMIAEKEKGKFDKLHEKEKLKEKNRLMEMEKLKERNKIMDMDTLTEKEKETLSKLITPPISKVGKIPKKSSASKEDKPLDEKNKTSKEGGDSKIETKKHSENKKEENNIKHDIKKVARPLPEVKRDKEKKWSIEPKRALPVDQKPKTVKVFNAKLRSTGLEEEVKPPPTRKDSKDHHHHKKEKTPAPPVLPPLNFTDKKPIKRSSPPPPDVHIPEKKLKPESPVEEKKHSDKPGIKLIPPKPRPMFLQESDVFMDAMLAANTMKESRKIRKRKASISKDDAKKDGSSPNHSPSGGAHDDPSVSPSAMKPTFKFYQETMDTSMDEEKSEEKVDDENLEFAEPNSEDMGEDHKSMSPNQENSSVTRKDSGGMKGVLVHLKSRKQKKSVSWKEDGLEAIRYFELDENERVNVTKNFTDMKNHEKELEREHFQIVRKLAGVDVMEERIRWQALIPIDMSTTAAVVAAGKNSQEKDIQYAREKTTPAAIYFNRRSIPDAPAEPDLEIHATTDPTIIPLDDITGSLESTNDFTTTPWPEPKGAPPAPPPPPVPAGPPVNPFPPPAVPAPGPFPMPPGPFMPGPPGPGMPMPPGDWRTGDGNMVEMSGPPGMFPPGPMMPPGMQPMPMMMPLMSIPTNPEDMPPGPQFHPGPFPLMGPPGPGPFQGPPGPPQGNWQGPPQGPPGGPNWEPQGPPPQHNQGNDRGGRYQGGGGGSWRGSRGSGGNRNTDGWSRGNSRPPFCNKGSNCRNISCRFRHPR